MSKCSNQRCQNPNPLFFKRIDGKLYCFECQGSVQGVDHRAT